MNADELRKFATEYVGIDRRQLTLLAEIAAQLAELNEWLRTPQAVKDARQAQLNGFYQPSPAGRERKG